MRGYKIVAKDCGEVIDFRFAGTNADARAARSDLQATHELKLKDVTIENADVPVAKAELLEFLNATVQEAIDVGIKRQGAAE